MRYDMGQHGASSLQHMKRAQLRHTSTFAWHHLRSSSIRAAASKVIPRIEYRSYKIVAAESPDIAKLMDYAGGACHRGVPSTLMITKLSRSTEMWNGHSRDTRARPRDRVQ